jgi:hypothetical protein
MTVSGSDSYTPNDFTPMEAINDKTGRKNKFGGAKPSGTEFELRFKFKKLVKIEGYAIRTADENLDPEEWSIEASSAVNQDGYIYPLKEID